VAIRTFIANSTSASTLVDPRRCVPKHNAKIKFKRPSDDAINYFKMKSDGPWEAPLERVALEFSGVVDTPGVIKQSFTRLPSVWALTPNSHWHEPLPYEDVLLGHYPPQANVYVDFRTGFSIDRVRSKEKLTIEDEVEVTLSFPAQLWLIVKRMDGPSPGPAISLNQAEIEISNTPDPNTAPICSPNDYLLHYFVTTMDLRNNPPQWPFDRDENNRIVSPEVYCSSSGYP
jgi:hypothetical protein